MQIALKLMKLEPFFHFSNPVILNPDNPGGIWSVSVLDDTRQMDFTLEESSWMTDKSSQNLT